MASLRTIGLGLVCVALTSAYADDNAEMREMIRQLQQRVDEQQHVIDSLSQRLYQPPAAEPNRVAAFGNKVLISGEAGIAFFESDHEGQFPHSEFRVDEAKLFLDAQVMNNVFFFVELNLFQRELDDTVRAGELYIDVENLSRLWDGDNQLNVRVGQLDIPFGEEYLTRDAIDNPLIAHTLADFWGLDEGIELYGSLGKVSYVASVLNGGVSALRDYTSDKSFAGRLSFDPTKWLHLSASGLHTGDLNAKGDAFSALWFGNGYFRAIGPAATTFHADVVEGDVILRLPRGHIWASGGFAHQDDNDPTFDGSRDIYFYSVEGLVNATQKLYGAARFSQIIAPGGAPIVGHGNFGDYFFNELTRNIWRLTVGAGYRFSPNLVLKADYSFERGTETGGEVRDSEDMFAVELAGKF